MCICLCIVFKYLRVLCQCIGGCIKVVSSVASTPLKIGVCTFWSVCKGLKLLSDLTSVLDKN